MKVPVSEQVQVNFRMPETLRDRIKISAEANNRSMNAEIVEALEEKFPPFSGEEKFFEAAMQMREALKLLNSQGGNAASKAHLKKAEEAIAAIWTKLDMTQAEFLRKRYEQPDE